ncbi:MAG: elongation factor P [Erythrobacter sp.]
MIFLPLFVVALIAAQAKGEVIETMPHGPYECTLPGDAAGPAVIPQPEASFTVTRASRYRTAAGRGTYLLKNDVLTFSGGPKNGERLKRTGTNELRALNADGSIGRMICVRVGTNY